MPSPGQGVLIAPFPHRSRPFPANRALAPPIAPSPCWSRPLPTDRAPSRGRADETHLPDSLPGLCDTAAMLAQACPDQTAPFRGIFGCDPERGWDTHNGKGTLFRLPLRTREAAGRSKIKDGKGGAPSFDDVLSNCVEPFLHQLDRAAAAETAGGGAGAGGGSRGRELILHRRLLFLRFIELIEVWVWPPGASQMSLLASARLVSADVRARTELQAARGSLMSHIKEAMRVARPPADDEYGGAAGALRYFAAAARLNVEAVPRPLFGLHVHASHPASFAGELEEVWLVSIAFGDRDDVEYAAAPRQRMEKLTLMPYGCCAALIARKPSACANDWELAPPICGRAYATLPLPIDTGLRVHLNGRWEIASDRNSLAPDDALPRHEWNVRLAGRVCAAAYARLLRELAAGCPVAGVPLSPAQRGAVVHALLPPSTLRGVYAGAAAGTMDLLSDDSHPTWRTFEQHGASFAKHSSIGVLHTLSSQWASVHLALFLHHATADTSGAQHADADVALTLGAMGCAITDAPPSVFEGLSAAAARLHRPRPKPLTPATVRAWLRSPAGGSALEQFLDALGVAERRGVCRKLLAYVAADVPRSSEHWILNPPEADRTYSSVWGDNALGTGHARSMLDSPQAWSAARNDGAQWIALKAADGPVSIAGIVLQGRHKSNHGKQHVRTVCVQFSLDGTAWFSDPGAAETYATNCKENDESHQRVEFSTPVLATHVRIHPVEHHHHISMRCGLLIGCSGAPLAGLPLVALADGTACALTREGDGSAEVLLDLESNQAVSARPSAIQ